MRYVSAAAAAQSLPTLSLAYRKPLSAYCDLKLWTFDCSPSTNIQPVSSIPPSSLRRSHLPLEKGGAEIVQKIILWALSAFRLLQLPTLIIPLRKVSRL